MTVPRDDDRPGRSSRGERRVLGVILAGGIGGIIVVLLVILLRSEETEPSSEITGKALVPVPETTSESRGLPPFGASFTDVARDSGVRHAQSSGATGERLLPETMGSGVAIGDLDDDGSQASEKLSSSDSQSDSVFASELSSQNQENKTLEAQSH